MRQTNKIKKRDCLAALHSAGTWNITNAATNVNADIRKERITERICRWCGIACGR